MKKCPFCAEEIQEEATKCRFCGEWLNKKRVSDKVSEAVQSDIKKADYSDTEFILGMKFPKAGKSITGWVFIVFGAAIGALLLFVLLFAIGAMNIIPANIISAKNIHPLVGYFIFFLFVCIGGFLGQGLHKIIKNKFEHKSQENKEKPPEATPDFTKIRRFNYKSILWILFIIFVVFIIVGNVINDYRQGKEKDKRDKFHREICIYAPYCEEIDRDFRFSSWLMSQEDYNRIYEKAYEDQDVETVIRVYKAYFNVLGIRPEDYRIDIHGIPFKLPQEKSK